MAVPIQPNLLTLFVDDPAHELHHFARPIGRRVTDGIAHAQRPRAAANCSRVQRANRFGIRARRVFRNEHDGQTFTDGEGDGLLG